MTQYYQLESQSWKNTRLVWSVDDVRNVIYTLISFKWWIHIIYMWYIFIDHLYYIKFSRSRTSRTSRTVWTDLHVNRSALEIFINQLINHKVSFHFLFSCYCDIADLIFHPVLFRYYYILTFDIYMSIFKASLGFVKSKILLLILTNSINRV